MNKDSDGENYSPGQFGGFEALRRKVTFYEERVKSQETYDSGAKLSSDAMIQLNSANEDKLFNLKQYKEKRVDIVHDISLTRGSDTNIEA
jgi:hypothetical protein